MNIETFNRLNELSQKPLNYKFTEKEIDFILKYSDIKDGKAKYGTWKQKRHNCLYICFMLDFLPFRVRKAGFDNSLKIISVRDLTDLEKLEEAQNYGSRNRIVTAWHYKYIEQLMIEDKKYKIETPKEFINHCKELGWSNPNYQNTEQLKLFSA